MAEGRGAGKGGENPGPGRVLTEDDILHYRRVVVALTGNPPPDG